MTGAEFRAIRQSLGLTLDAWGRALGYSGAHVRHTIHAMERGARAVPARTAMLARMLAREGERQ